MTEVQNDSEDHYAQLRAYAAAQKQATVKRLKKAIALLEAEKRPVNTFTIREVSGLDYMAYYRNPEAYALFKQHSTYLRRKREQERAKERAASCTPRHASAKNREALPAGNVQPRDLLLDYKKPRLVALVHEAHQERDQSEQHARAEKAKLTQRYEDEYTQLHQRYQTLLQDHMQCGLTIVRLQAQVAEYEAFIDSFRSSLRKEEFGPDG